MKKTIMMLALMAAAAVFGRQTATYTIENGATFTVSGVRGVSLVATNYCEAENTVLVVASSNATIKVTRPAGVSEGGLYFLPVATNGTLTIDLSDWAGCDFRMHGGVIANGNGALVIKGLDSITIGDGIYDPTLNFGASDYAVYRNSSRPVAFRNVTFQDSNGDAYVNPAGFTLAGRVLDWGISSSATCPWTVAQGAFVATEGQHGIVSSLTTDGVLTIPNYNLIVLAPAALNNITKVRVPAGSTFKIQPRTVSFYKVSETEYRIYGWDGRSSGATFTNDVELLDAEAQLVFTQHYDMTYSGDVTGTGKVTYEIEHRSSSSAAMATMSGNWGFSGPFTLRMGAAATNYNVKLTAGANMANCPLTISAGYWLNFAGGVSSSTMPALTGTVASTASSLPAIKFTNTNGNNLAIGDFAGEVYMTGTSQTRDVVTVSAMKRGAILRDNTLVSVLPGEGLADAIRLTNPCGNILYRPVAADGTVELAGLGLSASGEYQLTAKTGYTYSGLQENVRVEATNGVSTTVLANTTAANYVLAGGSLTLGVNETWKEKVMLWMDPSETNSWEYWTYNGTIGYDDYGNPVVGPWGDWREGKGAYYFINEKHYLDIANIICPVVFTNSPNGLAYFSCSIAGGRYRRMSIYPAGSTNETSTSGYTTISPKFAIVVFNSAEGGGQALFGNSSCAYQRGGTLVRGIAYTNSIFADGTLSTWIDGESVDPSATAYSGGWQIISVDTSNKAISGIGFNSGSSVTAGMGGQIYGEMLFFDSTPTEIERTAAERYLAKKWGILGAYKGGSSAGTAPKAALFGTGTVTLDSDAVLSGAFNGTVDLNGKSLSFASVALPPSEADIAALNPAGWFDPDLESQIYYTNDKKSNGVKTLYDRRATYGETGAICLDSVSRNPMAIRQSRGIGPQRNWLDFSSSRFPSGTQGRSLRVQNYDPNASNIYRVDPIDAKTVVMVQDSSRGGGTPFMSTVSDTGTMLSPRLTTYAAMPPEPALPIWRDKSATTFANGETRLDGKLVNGVTGGFNARPEVLSAVNSTSFPFGATGYCVYMEGVPVETRPDVGEIVGEVLVFAGVLSTANREKVEAYLMHKWLGTVSAGYGVYTNMTITGGGTVTVAAGAQRPKFGAGFTGTASLADSAFAFTIDESTKTVAGALDFGGATLSLPGACTLDVTFSPSAATGTYRLISAGALANEVSWTLNLHGSVDVGQCKVLVGGGNVDLVVVPKGTAIILR
ncbi:MAG: hypothetical protein PHV28_06915 [Kiritimatiellae bacterium]|nr:hypothetical protein [Kiritimatiellia bacterium]